MGLLLFFMKKLRLCQPINGEPKDEMDRLQVKVSILGIVILMKNILL